MRHSLVFLLLTACSAPSAVELPHKGCGCFSPPTVECDGACYGEMVFEAFCVMCHRTEDGPLGPSLLGQFGTARELAGERVVVMDGDYIRDSLTWPRKEVPVEWVKVDVDMPSFHLGPELVDPLIEHLGARGSPPTRGRK